MRRNILILGTVIAAFVAVRIAPQVQGSIVELRLAALNKLVSPFHPVRSTQQEQRLRTGFEEVGSVADISYRYHIPVDPSSLSRTQGAIETSLNQPSLPETTRQLGLIAAAKLANVADLRKTEGKTRPLQSYLGTPKGGNKGLQVYPIMGPITISNQNLRFQGDHSVISGYGVFIIEHSTVIFDGIDFYGEKPFVESYIFPGAGSAVTVRNSVIENVDQRLGGVTWVNVRFQHSRIEMGGGSFTLINVSFDDCDLRLLFGSRLQETIAKSGGRSISFAFEGATR